MKETKSNVIPISSKKTTCVDKVNFKPQGKFVEEPNYEKYCNNDKDEFLDMYKCYTSVIIMILCSVIYYSMLRSGEWFTNRAELLLDSGACYWPSIFIDGNYGLMFTALFIHANIFHVIANIGVLIKFCCPTERALGKFRYLILFIGSGIIGNWLSAFINMILERESYSVGASGAIFGVMSGYYLFKYYTEKTCRPTYKRMIFTPTIIAFATILLIPLGVDGFSHIGGAIGGLIISFLFRKKMKMYVSPFLIQMDKEGFIND